MKYHSLQFSGDLVCYKCTENAITTSLAITDDEFRELCHRAGVYDYVAPGKRGAVAQLQPNGTVVDFDLYEYAAHNTNELFTQIFAERPAPF